MRPRSIGRRGRILGFTTLMALGAAAPATPAVVAGGEYMFTALEASPSISGMGARWSLPIEAEAEGAMVLRVQRRNAAGNATAEFGTRVDGIALDCTPKLTSCLLSDGAGLGTYGKIEMTFSQSAPRRVRELTCPGTDTIWALRYRRQGVLSGTLRLATKVNGVGTIRNGTGAHRVPATFPATITQRVTTGVSCGPAGPCAEAVALIAPPANLSAERRIPNGRTRLLWNQGRSSTEPSVIRYQLVRVNAPSSGLAINPDSLGIATLDLDAGAPFLTGGALFAPSEPKQTDLFLGCDVAESRKGTMLVSMTVDLPWAPAFTFDDEVTASAWHVIE